MLWQNVVAGVVLPVFSVMENRSRYQVDAVERRKKYSGITCKFDKDVELIFIIDCVSDILFHITSACEK